jgi:hypothetical protein
MKGNAVCLTQRKELRLRRSQSSPSPNAKRRIGGICHDAQQALCIKAFSKTDFTEDPKKFTGPTLTMRGDDDQIALIDAAGLDRRCSWLVAWDALREMPGSESAPQSKPRSGWGIEARHGLSGPSTCPVEVSKDQAERCVPANAGPATAGL